MSYKLTVASAAVLFLGTLGSPGTARAENLKLDPAHSFLVFQIGHMDVSRVWGRVNGPTGTVNIDDAKLDGSSIQVSAKAENIDTGVKGRDDHLKRPDFFDAKQFPDITFKSTSIKKTGDNSYEVTGDLAMHGQSKPITVTLTKLGAGDKGPPMGYRAGYETSFTIKRSDWGMTNMVGPVGDEVKLFINLECTR
ncbi:MAG TPA: YceI family protein [Tepidisphaeraceae bacterium]|jgi:polyisoprenoid-binding protein YceI